MRDDANPLEESKQVPLAAAEVTENVAANRLLSAAEADKINAPPQATHWPSIHKAYDHAAIVKGFKDRDFDQKERVDMEALKMALAFVQK